MTDLLEKLKTALAGKYEIEKELGHGGMATVYLARDVKHNRDVAVKVLKPELAEALGAERFLREIEIAAGLSHPHILPLHDSGEADGFLYYVMPYVAGESLRELIQREKQLSLEVSLQITREVADALGYAHSHGIVHRDIKPENVMLGSGHALVADFGIARAVSDSDQTQLTEAGLSIGTPAYMSPEQATGEQGLDGRSDIYSLGCLLFEMLAGEPPYSGATPQAILAKKAVDSIPRIEVVRETVPGAVAATIRKALAKVPADRFPTTQQFVESLGIPSIAITAETMSVPTSPGKKRHLGPAIIGGATLLALIGFLGSNMLTPESFTITTSNIRPVTSAAGLEFQPSLSPDGKEVAYVVGPLQTPQVVIRSTINISSGGENRPGEGNRQWVPNWTSDGASVRYRSCESGGCKWMRVGRMGGASITIGSINESSTQVWSPDGNRVAFTRRRDSIFTFSIGDAEPQLLDAQSWGIPHSYAWSPDGQLLAYVIGNPAWPTSGNLAPSEIWVIGADGGDPVGIAGGVNMNLSPQWLPDSRHLMFISTRDGPRGIYLAEVGPEGPVGEFQTVLGASDAHSISLSEDGKKLAYSRFQFKQNIWSIPIPRSGMVSISEAQPVSTGNHVVESHDLSPDGQSIAYMGTLLGNLDIFRIPVEGGSPQLVVGDPAMPEEVPAWSPDGTEIAYHGGGSGIKVIPSNGGTPRVVADPPGFEQEAKWSPSGLQISYYRVLAPEGSSDGTFIVSRDSVGGAWSDPVLLTADFYCGGGWSADGGSLLCRPPNFRGFAIVSTNGDVVSQWDAPFVAFSNRFSPDGSVVYFNGFQAGNSGVWAMPVSGEGEPTRLVAFDDPSLEIGFFSLTVGPEHFYITVSEYESDIYVMDLEWED